ncbi:MAG TPA: MFS transporter [Chloroflexota bacterium]|nr:MFS transporter [Chloroflexota bacterium]
MARPEPRRGEPAARGKSVTRPPVAPDPLGQGPSALDAAEPSLTPPLHAPLAPAGGAPAAPAPGPDVSVWRNAPFMRLWIAQAITQTAHNALWYALMVLVEERSHSTTQLGVTILTVVVPSVLFGVVAGVLVDHWEKRRVLVICNLLRALLMLGFVAFDQWVVALFVLSFTFSTVTQFFAPAETSLIPALVPQRRLLQANSFFHITFISSQLAGLVLIGPLVVKLFGMTTFFLLEAAALALSAALVWGLPATETVVGISAAEEGRRVWRRLRHDLGELVDLLRADSDMAWAMLHLTLGSTLTLIVAMLAPNFVVQVLHISAEDMVYVLAPAGLGMLGAALSLQHVGDRFAKQRLIHYGLGAVGGALLLVGGLPELWEVLPFTQTAAGEANVHSLMLAVMAVTLVAGVGFACIIVPAQTILQEHAPPESRARIFAVQLMLGSVASVVPLIFIGGIADLVGSPLVFAALGAGLLVLLTALAYRQRHALPGQPRLAPADRDAPR